MREKKRLNLEAKQRRLAALRDLKLSFPQRDSEFLGDKIKSQHNAFGEKERDALLENNCSPYSNVSFTPTAPVKHVEQIPQSRRISPMSPDSNSGKRGRKRGATVGQYDMRQIRTKVKSPMRPFPVSSFHSTTNNLFSQPEPFVVTPPVTSMSQPATPESMYQSHVSMLSSDLRTSNNSHLPTTSSPPFNSPTGSSGSNMTFCGDKRASVDLSSFSWVFPTSTSSGTIFPAFGSDDLRVDLRLSPLNEDASFRSTMSQIAHDYDASTSSSPIASLSSGVLAAGQMQQPIDLGDAIAHESVHTGEHDSWIGQNTIQDPNYLPGNISFISRRCSSCDPSAFWQRTSNTDAAIARFFAKVLDASDSSDMDQMAISKGSGPVQFPCPHDSTSGVNMTSIPYGKFLIGDQPPANSSTLRTPNCHKNIDCTSSYANSRLYRGRSSITESPPCISNTNAVQSASPYSTVPGLMSPNSSEFPCASSSSFATCSDASNTNTTWRPIETDEQCSHTILPFAPPHLASQGQLSHAPGRTASFQEHEFESEAEGKYSRRAKFGMHDQYVSCNPRTGSLCDNSVNLEPLRCRIPTMEGYTSRMSNHTTPMTELSGDLFALGISNPPK